MKNVTVSLGLSITILALCDYYRIISDDYSSITCLQNFDGIGFSWFVLLSAAFLFSFILNLGSKSIHQQWWKFARIALPLTLLIATVINLRFHHNNFGTFNMDNMFDLPILILLYLIFILGSIIQIWRGYQSK